MHEAPQQQPQQPPPRLLPPPRSSQSAADAAGEYAALGIRMAASDPDLAGNWVGNFRELVSVGRYPAGLVQAASAENWGAARVGRARVIGPNAAACNPRTLMAQAMHGSRMGESLSRSGEVSCLRINDQDHWGEPR